MQRWVIFGVPFLLLAGFIGWRVNQKQTEAAAAAKQQASKGKAAAPVEVTSVARADVVKTFEVAGTVEAPAVVDIVPKLAGRVLFLQKREGDRVTAGEVLVRLDTAEVEAEVRQRQAVVAQAQSRLAEARVTQGAQSVNLTTEVSKAQAALRTAQATEKQVRADREAQIATAQAAVTNAQAQVDAGTANIARAEAAIRSAQANVANARVQLERQEALFKEGATAQEVVDNVRTQVQVQQETVEAAKKERDAAISARDSAIAQKRSAEKQVEVVTNKANADVSTAAAAIAQARATLKGTQANNQQRPAYAANLNALQATVTAAEADLRASEARRADTVLRSPLTGVVISRTLDPGALASPTQPILAVQAARNVWLNIAVPEEVVRQLSVGQTAQVAFDSLPGRKFNGSIARIDPAADTASRQFDVKVRLDNTAGILRAGTSGQASLVTNRVNNALVVPAEAVKRDRKTQESVVFVVGDDNKAIQRPVTTGISDSQGRVVITSGLKDGEKVVILTGRDLRDGQAVRPAGAEEKAGAEKGAGSEKGAGGEKSQGNSKESGK